MKLSREFGYLAAFVCLLSFQSSAYAQSNVTSTVTSVSGENGAFFVYVSTAPGGTIPNCATSGSYRYAINPGTASGAAQIAVALTAYTTKATIFIAGKGTCTTWPDTEDVNYIVSK
jgi:hypothetical protein